CKLEINKEYYYCTNCCDKKTDRNERNRMKYRKYIQEWTNRNEFVIDNIIFNVPKIGISDYDLNEDDRQEKYKDYDIVLCEKCDEKIYYYCYDCYNRKVKELKELKHTLQDYKLYNEKSTVKEVVERIKE